MSKFRKTAIAAVLLGAASLLTAPAQAGSRHQSYDPVAACRTQFDQAKQAYNDAFDARDINRFADFFREDATKVDPDGTIQYGKAAIKELFAGLFSMNFTSSFPVLKEVVDCNTAFVLTNATLTFPDDHFEETFVSSQTYTRDRWGRWRVLVTISANLHTTTLP
ncbi:YybH family protein [Amycolatopsis sp. NPDC059657]|uniref:YybH family protein n=1 Tax=Amycolatopsis sp. NPDC059657 TaxID=3346899 RepID=UPI003671E51B